MKRAFTIDDLPLWPMSYPPEGYTAAGIVEAVIRALEVYGLEGVHAFCTSWSLERHPEVAQILDDWVAAGHHVANHTHGHVQLVDVGSEAFIAQIDRAEELLAPWHLHAPRGLTPVEVTTWACEWTWNRACRNTFKAGDRRAQGFVRERFLDFRSPSCAMITQPCRRGSGSRRSASPWGITCLSSRMARRTGSGG